MASFRFDKDKCMGCGGYAGRPITKYRKEIDWLRSKTFNPMVCSDDCYEKIVEPYLGKKWAKTWGESDEWKEELAFRLKQERDEIRYARECDRKPDFTNLIDPNRGAQQWFRDRDEAYKKGADAFYDIYYKAASIHQKKLDDEAHEKLFADIKKESDASWAKINKGLAEEEREAAELAERLKPKPIPQHLRFEHTHILGPSGSGKTTLIKHLLMNDLYDYEQRKFRPPTPLVIIDPKGTMVERLARLKMFTSASPYRDRLLIIDPFQRPALNMFSSDSNSTDMVSHFAYIFSTQEQKLTGNQANCFAFCVQLLFTIPGANLMMLFDVLDDAAEKRAPNPIFKDAISRLNTKDDIAIRRFFENDYYSAQYAATRTQIKSRVWGVVQNKYLLAMFNAGECKLNMRQCLYENKILLVNTRMVDLQEDHKLLGRYIIALVVDAIKKRQHTTPVYFYIDEFQEFADAQKTPSMLRLLREYMGATTIAHQNMFCAELDDDIRSAISNNTCIKFASNSKGRDLSYMANDMGCENEFLFQTCAKNETHIRFGCTFTGLAHPFRYETPLWPNDTLSQFPTMDDENYASLMQRNEEALRDNTHDPPKTVGGSSEPIKQPAEQVPAPVVSAVKERARNKEEPTPLEPSPRRFNDPHTGDHAKPADKWGDD
jgi:hypothetical protein